jgi:hypothetical protein
MKTILHPRAKTEANCGPSKKAHQATSLGEATRSPAEDEAFCFDVVDSLFRFFLFSPKSQNGGIEPTL